MIKLSRVVCLTCLFAGLAFAAAAAAETKTTPKAAETKPADPKAAPKADKQAATEKSAAEKPAAGQPAQEELSPKSVRLISGFALSTIPSEIKQPDGTVIKIDRSNVDNIVVPMDDARRVIMTARNSAHAQVCDLPELQAENYLAMMRAEQAKKKWSKEQMLFINRLHLFTVMWLTGNVRFMEKDGKKEPQIISEPDKGEKKTCTPEEKAGVKANIEAYLKSAQKS
jgi:hypothetical protein